MNDIKFDFPEHLCGAAFEILAMFSFCIVVSFGTLHWGLGRFYCHKVEQYFPSAVALPEENILMCVRMILVFGKNISQVAGITFNFMSSQQHSVKSKFERYLEMFDSSPKIRPH